MYSHRSKHSHSRQYSDRSSRQWDRYNGRGERREPHKDKEWDLHHECGGSMERTSRSKEYSDSPKRLHSNDLVNRERSRKSPMRRRMSSPDWGSSEKRRRRFTDGDEDDYRYRRAPDDKASRLSPDSSHAHVTKDFKYRLLQEDFKYRKTTQDSRHRYPHEGIPSTHHYDDSNCKGLSGYNKDRDGHERSWDRSPERTQSQDRLTKVESDVTKQRAAVPEHTKATKGFQRFLDVLNKGVNVATLTKIVTQTSAKVDNRPHSPTSSMNTTNHSWFPGQQLHHQNFDHCSESEGSQRLVSQQPQHRSFSPKVRCLSDENSLQRGNGEQNYSSSNGLPGSPSVVNKMTLTPEDEYKHKQVQDVLQAIGVNLGFEELGLMSHRIQERLYGKKDSDHHCTRIRERDTKRAPSPRLQNESSSSRSSFSPSTQEYYMRRDSYSAQRDLTKEQLHAQQAIEYDQNSNSSILQESEYCEPDSKDSTSACQSFYENPTYSLSVPSPAPTMPMHSPLNCPLLPYPALPPNLSQAGPGHFLPCMPPFLPYPHAPPMSILPAVFSPTRHLIPQYSGTPQPLFNLPIQPLNTSQKSKTSSTSRPRCLQVVETKQPG